MRAGVCFRCAIIDRQNNQVLMIFSVLSTVINDSLYFRISQLYCESESANRNTAYEKNDEAGCLDIRE